MAQALARVAPARLPAAAGMVITRLTGPQKAAIIVRLMLAEGAPIPLANLPESLQAELAQQIGAMRLVDRETLQAVVAEFAGQLEQAGLSFPGGLEGALAIMDGHISQAAAGRLRRMMGNRPDADPWERIAALPSEVLEPVIADESTEISAVLLSKLPAPKAAEILSRLPGEKARRVAFAVMQTGNVDPVTVRRIGFALASQLEARPARAFEAAAAQRVGAILNVSAEATRETVLQGLDEEDAAFAGAVRRAIFTFVHLPQRLAPRDVPRLVRAVPQPVLVTALAGAQGMPDRAAAADFLLANLSQRMAQALREEIAERGRVKEKDAEAAMNEVIAAIRSLAEAGEVQLNSGEDD